MTAFPGRVDGTGLGVYLDRRQIDGAWGNAYVFFTTSGAEAPDAFVIGATSVTLGVCGSSAVRFSCKSDDRRATYFRVVWSNCPDVGRVKLRGQIPPAWRLCPVRAALRARR